MTLSEIEIALAALRERFGDVEVNEATPEYGYRPFTKQSFDAFLKPERTIYPDGRPDRIDWVMGNH